LRHRFLRRTIKVILVAVKRRGLEVYMIIAQAEGASLAAVQQGDEDGQGADSSEPVRVGRWRYYSEGEEVSPPSHDDE
jgi:hypothetical protein